MQPVSALPRRGRHWLPALALASWLVSAAAAGPAVDARAWIARMQAAAGHVNYQGTLVYTAPGMLSTARVAHFCVGDRSYQRVETLDGDQQRVYRAGDAVTTLLPQSRRALVEKRLPIGGLAAPVSTPQPVEPRALEQYALLDEGGGRFAGRDVQVVLLQPRDDMRYAQRLWADRVTGLMLRADVIGSDRTVLESAAFSAVDIGVRPQPDSVRRPMKKLDGYRIERPDVQPAQLDDEGWAIDRPAPGFRLAGCVKRALDGGGEPVLQAVFSDGLTHVSLFIEPHDAQRPPPPLGANVGATGALRQRRGDFWITVVGDVPPATLKAFADALERRRR